MDTILVANAGSSSVKFQLFAIGAGGDLKRQIKGQIDGIGSHARLRASAADGTSLVDRTYPEQDVSDVTAALHVAGAWLRDEQQVNPSAVGHRVVHGGPDYARPVLVTEQVLEQLEKYVPLAPLHQPYNLTPIKSIRARFPH